MKGALAFAACAACLACAAQERPQYFELRVDGAHDDLDKGKSDWNEAVAQLAWHPRKDFAVLGGARTTERFEQRDREGFAGLYLPLGSSRSVLHVEGTASPTHKVLARHAILADVAIPFGGGWVVTPGAKRSRYATGDVVVASAGIEKYSGSYRLGYTGYLSRVEGGSWSPAHRIAASWYRGELTSLTLSAARGREVENAYPLPLLVTDVRSYSLAGGVEITPGWGLTFEAYHVRQGELYTRRGARLGTRVLF